MAFLFVFILVFIFVFVVMVIVIVVFVFGVKNGAVGNVEITEVRLFEGGADVDASQIVLKRQIIGVAIINRLPLETYSDLRF